MAGADATVFQTREAARTRTKAPVKSPPSHAALGWGLDMLVFGAALAATVILRSSNALAPLWQDFGAATTAGFATWDKNEWALLLFQAFTLPPLLHVLNQYRIFRDPAAHWSTLRVLAAVGATLGALLAMLFVLRIHNVPRLTLVIDFMLLAIGASAWRAGYARQVRRRYERGEALHNVLILGTCMLAQRVGGHLAAEPMHGRRVIGFLTNESDKVLLDLPPEVAERNNVYMPAGQMDVNSAAAELTRNQARHMLAPIATLSITDIANALDGLLVEEVMIGPEVDKKVVQATLTLCQARGIDVHLIPFHYQELGIQPTAWSLGEFTLLDVHRRPISRLGWLTKRSLDIVGASIGLVLASPILLITAIAVKIDDPRASVFYKGMRVGLKGRQFRMVKFTTMRSDAQALEAEMHQANTREGPWFKLESHDDPRLTRVGRFIRKYSINEIPQFWNVLKGEMSLVGPRPPTPAEVATYVDYDFRYFRCLDVRPGITGLWQVTCKNDPSFDRRIDLDVEYIEDWSIWLDVQILLRTVGTVVREPED